MTTTLSLILPVRNVQAGLTQHVTHLLDVLEEMTHDFELVLVDDGSNDHTDELAAELTREYPQIRLVRHGAPLGNQAAVESGLRVATGAVVLVHPPGGPIHSNDLLRAWNSRNSLTPQVPAASAYPRPINSGLLERLRQWGTQAAESARGGKMPAAVPVLRRWENETTHFAESRTVVRIGAARASGEKTVMAENAVKTGGIAPSADTPRAK